LTNDGLVSILTKSFQDCYQLRGTKYSQRNGEINLPGESSMSQMSARLVMKFGATPNQEYPLDGRTITIIGREPINDIPLNDPEISRRHARIDFDGGRYLLEDLGSTNGTYLNGRRLTEPAPLKNGDVVEFGESISLTFQNEATADQTAPQMDSNALYGAVETEYEPQFDIEPTAQLPETDEDEWPPAAAERSVSTTTMLAGCGCLLLLLAVFCIGGLYILDARFPELLYCNWLSFIFENTTLCYALGS
jgi:pSer/pThr/pTyr-binding forkhead associated (FHA) protein